AAAEAAWESTLGRVELEGRNEDDFRIFYTALYHSLLMPTLAMDVDGSYRGFDGEVHLAEGFRYYTDFSLWDTFRTQHPLLTLLYPEWQEDMLASLLAMGRDGGFMPRWPLGSGYTGGMVGDSTNIVFADSMKKGLRNVDVATAYAQMRITAMGPTPEGAGFQGRPGIEDYLSLGYVPIEDGGWSASKTLEYAYADFALSHIAEQAGEADEAAALLARAGNWRNLLEPETGFLLGRNADGSFPSVTPTQWEDYYAEGNALQYSWYAPHDLSALAEATGGRERFLERLTDFFERSDATAYNPVIPAQYYWHGNEPDIHASWIFSALDQPADSARWVRWVLDRHYSSAPDGLPGNDDAGTLSAWCVFSSLGFFPIAGTDEYLLGSPLFSRATVHLANGDLVIEAPNASEAHLYPASVVLNGTPVERAQLRHDALAGATLEFDLTVEATRWATR
ncbi:MAG: glycoside hydrolase family 92 protein, partial [Myxococcota bacterium]